MRHGSGIMIMKAILVASLAAENAGIGVRDGSYSTECTDSTSIYCTSWVFNNGTQYSSSSLFEQGTVLTDVASVSISGNFVAVKSSGIPSWITTIDKDIYDTLADRPNASTDFSNGSPSVAVGDLVEWGTSVGYTSTRAESCASSNGYWPPGPVCPSDQNLTVYIPTAPTASDETCYQTMGQLGVYANGVALYGWSDGGSFENQDVWHQIAWKFEVYDVDINGGHAANGQYHLHGWSNGVSNMFNDTGDAKSAIWGFAADGYPILGPYVDAQVQAQSCWLARDFSDVSKGGCGTGTRSCVLVDPFDLDKGTRETNYTGPSTNDTVSTQSGNFISGASGIYFEDYYYNSSCTAQGYEYLDEHNGRVDPDYGYVYHVLPDSFPNNIGPTFKGKLDTSKGIVSRCQSAP